MSYKMIIHAVEPDAYQLRFVTSDGDSILKCEPRQSKSRVLEDAEVLRRGVLEDGRYAVQRDSQGRFAFNFLGELGEPMGVSALFPTPEGLGKAIAALKAEVPQAVLLDHS